jgi:hypothetical protein
MALMASLLIAAADRGQGRGNEASGIGGGAVLAGVIILVIIGIVVAYVVVSRTQRTRRGGTTPDEPHPPGRVGRL